jgi:hypothetical protein
VTSWFVMLKNICVPRYWKKHSSVFFFLFPLMRLTNYIYWLCIK